MAEVNIPNNRKDLVVLDASAILAVLYAEPGQEEIRRRIRGREVAVGAVNLSEVLAKLAEAGFAEMESRQLVGALAPTVYPFDEVLARVAGALRPGVRDRGLSLGDRACLALANSLGVGVLTADESLEDLDGIEVIGRPPSASGLAPAVVEDQLRSDHGGERV